MKMLVKTLKFASILVLMCLCMACVADDHSSSKPDLLVVSVATKENDGFRQFKRSCEKYGLDLKVFGLGTEWRGGTMETIGGGHKVNILKDKLKAYKNRDNLLIMFLDSYDMVLTAGKDDILEKFAKFDARVVFAAEDALWPDKTLGSKYPKVKENEKRFLNSGGFIGYAPDIYDIVSYTPIADKDDDQLYYTHIFLNRALRHEYKIKLDTRAEIFQNLHLALGEVYIKYKGDHSYLYNLKTGTRPIAVHGNGPIKPEFYRLSNYLADGWTDKSGCLTCKEDLLDLSSLKDEDLPTVMIAMFVETPTPYIKEYFERIAQLNYPKDKIDIFVHYNTDYHTKDVTKFQEDVTGEQYSSVRVISPSDKIEDGIARNWAIEDCIKKNCGYMLAVDSMAQITSPEMLRDLITQNRSIIAPLFKRPGKLWSNFWGALSKEGYYARSEDYMAIIDYSKVGLWNSPFISNVMLIQGQLLPQLRGAYTQNPLLDPDMSFCDKARKEVVFMYVDNQKYWGHLINPEGFATHHLSNELFNIFENRLDWENRYIHKDYPKALQADTNEQPCPDVYWFPIVTETFCDEFVAEFENYGRWSGGKNEDPRLAGGYENVPTVDIHMNQVGLEKQWLHFLQHYVRPLQEKVFTGYSHNPVHAIMNFIVRYKPEEQPLLKPHHDASTYTINVALNTPGVDYEGGGCRFIRYNCSVTDSRKGWMVMHPGRLTHYHEGLRTTKGTRYIMISFIDP